jgi:choline dehydrogenase-like flavoprotein
MAAILDARTLPDGTTVSPDLCIIGGGPAGISLALALKDTPLDILLLEAGGTEFDPKVQDAFKGAGSGVPYLRLDESRLRRFGGSTNHWGGWSRPLDAVDFEKRDWVAHSGWPFGIETLRPYFARAQALAEIGPWVYDQMPRRLGNDAIIPLAPGGVYTSWFQFSKTRAGDLPTPFGERYRDDLKATARVTTWLEAPVTALRLSANAKRIERLELRAGGKNLTIRPRFTVLAVGALEKARLLLDSNDVMKNGIGNQNDVVGRFFADHPIPRDVATLVLFNGQLPKGYFSGQGINNTISLPDGTPVRAVFSPTMDYVRAQKVIGSLTTVEYPVPMTEAMGEAVAATAQSLDVDASNARAYSLGTGLEAIPDPERRVTLGGGRDAFGMPRLILHVTTPQPDFDMYRKTLRELGRQLLASKMGMLRLNHATHDEWVASITAVKGGPWWGSHHMGTTRMHGDPKQGVVDADGKVHGIANLYVAGASVFPTYGSSNPTLNLIALTLRLGDHLKTVLA